MNQERKMIRGMKSKLKIISQVGLIIGLIKIMSCWFLCLKIKVNTLILVKLESIEWVLWNLCYSYCIFRMILQIYLSLCYIYFIYFITIFWNLSFLSIFPPVLRNSEWVYFPHIEILFCFVFRSLTTSYNCACKPRNIAKVLIFSSLKNKPKFP